MMRATEETPLLEESHQNRLPINSSPQIPPRIYAGMIFSLSLVTGFTAAASVLNQDGINEGCNKASSEGGQAIPYGGWNLFFNCIMPFIFGILPPLLLDKSNSLLSSITTLNNRCLSGLKISLALSMMTASAILSYFIFEIGRALDYKVGYNACVDPAHASVLAPLSISDANAPLLHGVGTTLSVLISASTIGFGLFRASRYRSENNQALAIHSHQNRI